MPELPEVEVLVRHLRPLLHHRTIRAVEVWRPKVLRPTRREEFHQRLGGATFTGVTRRGKYLLFTLRTKGAARAKAGGTFTLLGHLGMTGRMFLARKGEAPGKHAAVALDLGARKFVYEDTRYFGRLTLDLAPLARLGPEPLEREFTPALLLRELKRSRQAVKVKLLDQSLVAGIGNIYASEALFRAGISPRRAANRLTRAEAHMLWRAIRGVLGQAIRFGSTVPLNFNPHDSDGLFYYGSGHAAGDGGGNDFYTERLRVYDRRGKPCWKCGMPVKRIVQAARSTFFCPQCQKR